MQETIPPRALDPENFPWVETLLRLGCAAICGLAVGWEREVQQRPAGLRTHALVALGAAVFTIAAVEFHAAAPATPQRPDVLRVVGEIAGGIGFLGAGAIIQSRG